jgi:hypothetical protein
MLRLLSLSDAYDEIGPKTLGLGELAGTWLVFNCETSPHGGHCCSIDGLAEKYDAGRTLGELYRASSPRPAENGPWARCFNKRSRANAQGMAGFDRGWVVKTPLPSRFVGVRIGRVWLAVLHRVLNGNRRPKYER